MAADWLWDKPPVHYPLIKFNQEESSVVINTISQPISHLGLLLSLYFMAMVAQPIQKDSV